MEQDPIDRIAIVFTTYCHDVLRGMTDIKRIVDESPTIGDAMTVLLKMGLIPSDDVVHLETITMDVPKLQRCLADIEEIKKLARMVFAYNIPDEEKIFVFSQEISFSFAAKSLVSMGLKLNHYSNAPTNDEVIRAEINIALRTPIIVNGVAYCSQKEMQTTFTPSAVGPVFKRPNNRPAVVMRMRQPDLTCKEIMPTRIQPPPRPLPLPSGRHC